MARENRKLQEILRILHVWPGLIAGVFIVVMALSGMMIVFRNEIDGLAAPRIPAPSRDSGSPSLAAIERTVAALSPGNHITRVVFPGSTGVPLLVQTESAEKKRRVLFFDPASGRALGERRTLLWLDWVVDLHQNLLSGKQGRSWTGVIGFALALISASGLLSWLAGRRDWKRALALPQPGPWRRVMFHGHKWAGLWANLFLLVVSLSGIVLAYPETTQRAIRALDGEPEPVTAALGKPDLSNGHRRLLPLDEYLHSAETAVPGGRVRELRIARPAQGGIYIALHLPGDIRLKGGNVVHLDSASAQVTSVEREADSPFSRKFVAMGNAIHKTEIGGLPVKFVWALFGVAPLLLFISGTTIWWQRRRTTVRPVLRVRATRLGAVQETLVGK